MTGSAIANVGGQAIGSVLFVRALRRAARHRPPSTVAGDRRPVAWSAGT